MRALLTAWREPAVRWHCLGVLIAMAFVAGAVVWQVGGNASDQADQVAREQVTATALTLTLPLTGVDLEGSEEWIDDLQRSAQALVDANEIAVLHLWDRVDATYGQLKWSTDPARIGEVLPLGGAQTALTTRTAVIEKLHDGSESEGPQLKNLYEIYLPFNDRLGVPHVLEIYKPVADYDRIRSDLLRASLPLPLLAVLTVGLATLVLSTRLARSVRRAERDRGEYARQALRARSEEHQRMSEVLHERTVQEIAAARMILQSARDPETPRELARALDQVTDLLASEVHDLRALLAGGEGATWQEVDLATALSSWTGVLPQPEVVRVSVDPPLSLHEPAVAIAFGVAKELIRNSVKHADPTVIDVNVRAGTGSLTLIVSDDGPGYDEHDPAGLGTRLIRHAVQTSGGTITLATGSTGESDRAGTQVTVQLPRSPDPTTSNWGVTGGLQNC